MRAEPPYRIETGRLVLREQKVDLLRRFRGCFDLAKDFVYAILSRDEGEPREVVVYSMFDDGFPGSPSAAAEPVAYDALGTKTCPA